MIATLMTLVVVWAIPWNVRIAWAQSGEPPSASQILDALKSKRQRGATPAERSREDAQRKLIEAFKAKEMRGLSAQERAQLAAIVKERPSIDLVIYFDFNSAEINASALTTLRALGQALKNAELNETTLLVAGHTDAKGSADYNQSLSERRAQAVKLFLFQKFGIPETQVLAVGYGKEQPKNPASPEADENRRVQVVNLGK